MTSPPRPPSLTSTVPPSPSSPQTVNISLHIEEFKRLSHFLHKKKWNDFILLF